MTKREQYINGEMTFEQYYTSIAKEAGVSMERNELMPKVVAALKAGDEHLNSIPLATWDRMGLSPISYHIANAFKAHGDYATAAGLVCMYKQAAKNAAQVAA